MANGLSLPAFEDVPLRDYQREIADSVLTKFKVGDKRVVAYLPTGGGKTRVAAALIAAACSRDKRCLFVVNSLPLLFQAYPSTIIGED